MECPSKAELIEERIDRILTQYRESPNLIGILRHDLGQIADAALAACEIPSRFDILDATGDQLTIIGKQLGWPREHCICVPVPVFGIPCAVPSVNRVIVGLCEGGVLAGCSDGGDGTLRLDDDEVYRGYLLARRFQARQLWDIDSLQFAAQHIWGETATVINLGQCRVCVQPGRTLTDREQLELPVAFRVLPLAPGITPYVSYETGKVFGIGEGWGGLCDGSSIFCPVEIDPYGCQ